MVQQGQVFELTRRGQGERLWAYRYRTGGRDSRRVQRGGFATEQDTRDALERELERERRERRIARSLTLAELVETYLAQHDVQPVTIEKLRYLLSKATAVFGDRRVGELTSQEIAAWRMTLSPGYRFEATQALRQVLHRAVAWGMIDVNPAKVGVDNPTPRRREQRPFESWAELNAVAARLAPRYAPMVIFAAATGLSSSRMDRARTARRRSPGAGRLRPPFVHEGSAEVDEDRGEPAGGAAASDRPGRDRTPAAQSEQPRCCFRASGAATSTCTTSATTTGSRHNARPGSNLCQDLRSPPHLRHSSPSVPVSRPSISPATWASA